MANEISRGLAALPELWVPQEQTPCYASEAWFDPPVRRHKPSKNYKEKPEILELKRICREVCPVVVECLANAMEEEGSAQSKDRHHIRGGLDPQERATLYTNTNRARLKETAA